jgi:hypothetical protein
MNASHWPQTTKTHPATQVNIIVMVRIAVAVVTGYAIADTTTSLADLC